MYNPDLVQLYMKFPQFRIQNNLVIDKKYKKPQNQRPLHSQMQNVQGVTNNPTDPNMQFPNQASNQPPIQNFNSAGNPPTTQGQYSMQQYPNQNQPQNQFEEEKFIGMRSNNQPELQISGLKSNLPQNVQQPGQSDPLTGQMLLNQQPPSMPPQQQNMGYQQPMNQQNTQMQQQNNVNSNANFHSSQPGYGQIQGQNNQQNTAPSNQFNLPQDFNQQNYSQYQNPNKLYKTDEFGPGSAPYNQPGQQQPSQPQPNQATNEGQSMPQIYHHTATSNEMGQPTIPLNQMSQNLNTQNNMPSLQSNMGGGMNQPQQNQQQQQFEQNNAQMPQNNQYNVNNMNNSMQPQQNNSNMGGMPMGQNQPPQGYQNEGQMQNQQMPQLQQQNMTQSQSVQNQQNYQQNQNVNMGQMQQTQNEMQPNVGGNMGQQNMQYQHMPGGEGQMQHYAQNTPQNMEQQNMNN